MIKGTCHSNRDSFKVAEYWPNEFVAVPQKGDYVENLSGTHRLMVCKITHCKDEEPYILVELTAPF